MSKSVKCLLKYSITLVCGLCIAGVILWNSDLLTQELQGTYRILSDAFSLPGFLCLFGGLSVWLSNEGAFDAVTWLVVSAAKALIPTMHGTNEKYGDYVARRRAKRASGYGFLFVCGAVFLAVSTVFLLLFYGTR